MSKIDNLLNALASRPNTRLSVLLCSLVAAVLISSQLVKAAEDIFDTGVRVHRGGFSESESQPADGGAATQEIETTSPETSTQEVHSSLRKKDCEGIRVHKSGSKRESKIRTHKAGTRSQRQKDRDWYNVPTHRMGEPKGQRIKTHRAGQRSGSKIKTHRAGFSTGSKIRTHKAGKKSRTCQVR